MSLLVQSVLQVQNTGISASAIAICASVLCSSIGGTWILTNKINNIDKKIDSHIEFHKGFEAGQKIVIPASAKVEKVA